MAAPVSVTITGPKLSKTSQTYQYTALVVSPDGSQARYLTWPADIDPYELCQALLSAWDKQKGGGTPPPPGPPRRGPGRPRKNPPKD